MCNLDPGTITLHRCHNGNIVLQFGVTMIHLQPHLFHQFAELIEKTADQMRESKLEIEMTYMQPGEA